MPKVYLTEADRLVNKKLRAFHGELFAHGVRNKDIAGWLGCTEQNVSQLWKNCSFSFKQYCVMQQELQKLRDKSQEVEK